MYKSFNVPIKTYSQEIDDSVNGYMMEVRRGEKKIGVIMVYHKNGKTKAKNLENPRILLKIKSTDNLVCI